MKTFFLATAAVLALGAGSAFAGGGEGPHANTQFNELPGVIAQAPVQQQAPSAYARSQPSGPALSGSHGLDPATYLSSVCPINFRWYAICLPWL